MMNDKNIEQLQSIAKLLRSKLNLINKNIIKKGVKEGPQRVVQINSDSQVQAMELFESVRPNPSNIIEGNSKSANKFDESKHIKSIVKKAIQTKNRQIVINSQPGQCKEQEERQKKDSKKASFNFNQNLIFTLNADRKWNQKITNQKKGKFQIQEQRAISDAIGQYLATNQLSFQQFVKWLSQGNRQQKNLLRKQKFFKLLSSVLPSRSPQSCYKYVVRNYNSFNHQGSWSPQEVDKLKSLVEKYGRKWTLIGKQLGRTSDNVYDKYRTLGEEEMQEKAKGCWRLHELISLLLEIERQTQIEFVDHNIKKELEREGEHNGIEEAQFKEHKYNSKLFTFHNIEVMRRYIDAKLFQEIDTKKLKWKKMAKEVKTKSAFECRNKVIQVLQVLFRNTKSLDETLVQFLQKEKAGLEHQIDWKNWKSEQFTTEQAKNRFMIIKKLVEGRNGKPFKRICQQIIVKIRKALSKVQKPT